MQINDITLSLRNVYTLKTKENRRYRKILKKKIQEPKRQNKNQKTFFFYKYQQRKEKTIENLKRRETKKFKNFFYITEN